MSWEDHNIVVCHFGTGFIIAAFAKGKLVNVNDANAGGPFSDTRAGEEPSEPFMDWVAAQLKSGKSLQDIKDFMQAGCGLKGLLGVKDLKGTLILIDQDDKKALLVYESMVARIAEEIVKRCSNLWTTDGGTVDKIIFTGGMANSAKFIDDIKRSILRLFVSDFDPAKEIMDNKVSVLAGSFEAQAMINAARRVLNSGEVPIKYGPLPS